MSEQMNGHAVKDAVDQPAVAKARAVIDTQVRQVLGVNVRGLLVSAPGVPPHELLNSMARVMGALLAEAIVADLGTTLRLRNAFKDAFADGVAKTAPKLPDVDQAILKRA